MKTKLTATTIKGGGSMQKEIPHAPLNDVAKTVIGYMPYICIYDGSRLNIK